MSGFLSVATLLSSSDLEKLLKVFFVLYASPFMALLGYVRLRVGASVSCSSGRQPPGCKRKGGTHLSAGTTSLQYRTLTGS